MTGAVAQVRALIWLRWQMVRSPGLRFTLLLTPVLMIWLMQLVARTAAGLTQPALAAAVELAPAAFLGFGFLAVVAPLTAGGGTELVPSDQLVAYPVQPRTLFLGGLLLAPVNLVWAVQLLVLTGETAYLTLDRSFLPGAVITTAYVVCLTVVGQALAWAVVGLRQLRTGRRAVAMLAAALVAGLVVIVRAGLADEVLRASPTHAVVDAVSGGVSRLWLVTLACLLGGSAVGLYLGNRACAWAVRRPTDATRAVSVRALRRRSPRRTALAELVAIDRASVWRAPALRRGGIVLALLPGMVALGTAIPWESLVVLPGLVAAGAGLLFGVNAFCLDGSGALWLASLPHEPGLQARAKLAVLNETIAAAIVIAAFTGSLRSPGLPTVTTLSAIVAGSIGCWSLVVATCMWLSVTRPHRADLRGPRDSVAPPGALAAASAWLAVPAGTLGLLLEVASQSQVWWLPPVLVVPVVVAALLWLRRSLAAYAETVQRAHVVQVVSAG